MNLFAQQVAELAFALMPYHKATPNNTSVIVNRYSLDRHWGTVVLDATYGKHAGYVYLQKVYIGAKPTGSDKITTECIIDLDGTVRDRKLAPELENSLEHCLSTAQG